MARLAGSFCLRRSTFKSSRNTLKLASRHLPRCLHQASMDGSDLVFLEVGTGDKSPIAKLTVVVTARSTRSCHGCVLRERKKLEIGEKRELEDAAAKECDKKKTRKIKPMRGGRRVQAKKWQDLKFNGMAEVHDGLAELSRMAEVHGGLAELNGMAEVRGGLAELNGMAEVHDGLAKFNEMAEVHGGLAELSGMAEVHGLQFFG